MANKNAISKLLAFVAWLTGVIVALSVGFAMINGTLGLPAWLGGTIGVPVIAGYVVIVATILGVVLAIVNEFK